MDYKIQVVETAARPALSIRTRSSVTELPLHIGEACQRIMAYLSVIDEEPNGMPFVAYYNLDMNDLDVEIGFPVAKSISGSEDIQASQIPGGKKLTCMHQGPYQQMEETYKAMAAYIEEHRLHPSGVVYESYYNDPARVPEEELLTLIEFLLLD